MYLVIKTVTAVKSKLKLCQSVNNKQLSPFQGVGGDDRLKGFAIGIGYRF
jgi:hypothetical protein